MTQSKYALSVVALIVCAITGSIYAQSTDRDRPTPLTSNELRGFLEENKDEHFYSFTAGPGELILTADIAPSKGSGTTNIAFELLGRNGADAIMCCEGVQGDFGATGREVKSIQLSRRQTIILHTTNNGGSGTFQFRFSGPAVTGGLPVGRGYTEIRDTEQDRETSGSVSGRGYGVGGQTVDVPSSGILHIRMKDGTYKDIDLSHVRNISVRRQ